MNNPASLDVWAGIAGLRPRLQSHLRWHRHCYRSHPWWVLQDPASGQHYHFTEKARRLMTLLDGTRTLEQARVALAAASDAVSIEEVVSLVARLQSADLLRFHGPADPAALFERWRLRRSRIRRSAWLRPLAIRIPLLDPSALLDDLLPAVRPLFGRLPFIVWLLLVGLAIPLGLQHQSDLAAHGSSRFLDPVNLLLLWLAYPLVKGLHELGHACAIRVWGGSVREMGVMLLVFVPVPYVDGSAATAFPDKRRRMLVGAAGIMVEALLASMALFLWLAVQPGLLRDLAFDVMVIGGVSTLLFNGNPLLRFDGYFVLADAIEIPNLSGRARQYYGYLARRYLLGVSDALSPAIDAGERPWFLFYGLASAVYGVVISLTIALYVAGKFFVIGMLLAAFVVTSRLLSPLLSLLRYLLTDPGLRGRRPRALSVGLGAFLGLALLLLALPIPSNTLAEGVLRIPQQSIVRAAENGEVVALFKGNGESVLPGEPLLRLQDTELETRLRVLEARAQELVARLERASMSDRVQAGILREQLDEVGEERRSLQRRLDNLIVASPAAGVVDLPQAADLPGRFVAQGEMLGMVRNDGVSTARVVVPQAQVARVRGDTLAIDVRVAGAPVQRLPATAMFAVPAGTRLLPSASLGSEAGGLIAVDLRDERGVTAVEPVFHFDLALPPGDGGYLPGARVQVRFMHSAEPLGPRWYRSLRQLLLARLAL